MYNAYCTGFQSFDTPSLSDNNDSNSSSDNEVEEEAVC